MISAQQHPNLVKLYGCCVEGNQLLLVYEYMKNNCLSRAIFGKLRIFHISIYATFPLGNIQILIISAANSIDFLFLTLDRKGYRIQIKARLAY